MPVTTLSLGARIDASRGSPAVCITVMADEPPPTPWLSELLASTPPQVPILVYDTRPDPRGLVAELERASPDRVLHYLHRDQTEAGNTWAGPFELTAAADLVLLSAGALTVSGWLDGLRAAAYADSRVATVSALQLGAERTDEADFVSTAAAIQARSQRIRPRIARPDSDCVYVRRSAVELVGGFDPAAGEQALLQFSERCVAYGLAHLVADEVLVDSARPPTPRSDTAGRPALGRSLAGASRASTGLSVVIDARTLGRPMTGTEVQLLEIIAALARTEQVRVTVITPEAMAAYAIRALEQAPSLRLVGHRDAHAIARRADLVHRPYQVGSPADLALLVPLGERLVVTHHDLISYHNPSYFPDAESWHGYRRLTRLALSLADHVVFGSLHARDDALAEELVEPGRASVVRHGVDNRLTEPGDHPTPPPAASALPGGAELAVCLGTDYLHKNRPFALRMLGQLQERHGWRGYLVLAGPKVSHGSSANEEQSILAAHPGLRAHVIDAGAVSEAERAWLLRHARVVLYPTVCEGFGLVPFEAARHGAPCMWAPGTALDEVLPSASAGIVAWDPARSADNALELLRDGEPRERLVAAVRDAATGLTWDAAAARLLELYGRICDAPAAPAATVARGGGVLGEALTEDAMRLVGPGGSLPADVHRPLLALANSSLSAPALAALKLGYRLGYRLRRWRAWPQRRK